MSQLHKVTTIILEILSGLTTLKLLHCCCHSTSESFSSLLHLLSIVPTSLEILRFSHDNFEDLDKTAWKSLDSSFDNSRFSNLRCIEFDNICELGNPHSLLPQLLPRAFSHNLLWYRVKHFGLCE